MKSFRLNSWLHRGVHLSSVGFCFIFSTFKLKSNISIFHDFSLGLQITNTVDSRTDKQSRSFKSRMKSRDLMGSLLGEPEMFRLRAERVSNPEVTLDSPELEPFTSLSRMFEDPHLPAPLLLV